MKEKKMKKKEKLGIKAATSDMGKQEIQFTHSIYIQYDHVIWDK